MVQHRRPANEGAAFMFKPSFFPLAADAAALPAVSRLACLFDAASDACTISRGSLCQLLAIACIAACHVTSYPCVGVRPPGPRKLSSTSTVSPQTIWWFQRCPLTIPSVPMTLFERRHESLELA